MGERKQTMHLRTEWLALFLVFVCLQSRVGAGEKSPEWLDTIPPVVKMKPLQRYHSSVFHVVLSTDENARIQFGVNSSQALQAYSRPITITREGPTVIFFSAEDDFGNTSTVDSVTYVLDTKPPKVIVDPRPGSYRHPISIRFRANEPARFYLLESPDAALSQEITQPFEVTNTFRGYLAAVDRAGNRAVSKQLSYIVDTTTVVVRVTPDGGLFNRQRTITFQSEPSGDVYYSFDALQPVSEFKLFQDPVRLPYGLTLARYYARSTGGAESEILTSRFVVDTVPPRLRMQARTGPLFDTLIMSTKEPSVIRYSLGARLPGEDSPVYRSPLLIPRKGKALVSADARDSAGNVSKTQRWERKYDRTPPKIHLSNRGGTFNRPVDLEVTANEDVVVYYTVDGSEPTTSSLPYTGPVKISKEGRTIFRCIGVDEAGNTSEERGASFTIDSKPPQIRVRIESNIQEDAYQVILHSNEQARIHFETGDRKPTVSSPVYERPIRMKTGQTLRYFAVDMAGNTTQIKEMQELDRPMVSASPPGGTYNRRLNITFSTNMASEILWRLAPDTAFHTYSDTVRLEKEGTYTLEYFSRNDEGMESPLRRSVYHTDWTPPHVDVTLRKGVADSIAIFFDCSENATIFYTLDGSSPLFAPRVRVAGNKFSRSKDRISVKRENVGKLAFYAEDAVGNQSSLSVMDLAKPRAVPNVVAGPERLYRKFLSVAFNTVDEQSQIYYARHGNVPTTDSNLYVEPLTLLKSDTILTFVVDAAGFQGEIDTFIYRIDLPPSPRFFCIPERPHEGKVVRFDASATTDQETPLRNLLFRWDFDGDGAFDTKFESDAGATHIFDKSGVYNTKVEVKDEMDRVTSYTRRIGIAQHCPEGMAFNVDTAGHGFCIDVYEWPNQKSREPRTKVSWVEARMICEKQGKRLCTSAEWIAACKGQSRTTYPYGSRYKADRCPTTGDEPSRSGTLDRCSPRSNVKDMVGNVWEWVADTKSDYPLLMGGSYRSGKHARCDHSFEATVGESSEDIGFRCCR